MYKYPVYQPNLDGNEKKYLADCIETKWVSSKGGYIDEFEAAFKRLLEVNHATTVSNGTVALHLALLALGIGEGDEVIVPTFTYIAPVNAITYTGAKPVFVDSDLDTWQMDPEDVRRKITNRTKAIIAVHLYGHPCRMDTLTDIRNEFGLFLIEDCAEALGSQFDGKNVGTFGDIATYSFYGNKTITTGEGGMVVTNDESLYDKVVHYKGQGLAKNREYWHDVIGYNYRMNNMCAALGLAQIERFEPIFEKKLQIASWYQTRLEDSAYTYHLQGDKTLHSYWMCSILVDETSKRDILRKHLSENGIETRPTFYTVHSMPMYKTVEEQYVVAENIAGRGMNLPSYPDLNEEDVNFISECILRFGK